MPSRMTNVTSAYSVLHLMRPDFHLTVKVIRLSCLLVTVLQEFLAMLVKMFVINLILSDHLYLQCHKPMSQIKAPHVMFV